MAHRFSFVKKDSRLSPLFLYDAPMNIGNVLRNWRLLEKMTLQQAAERIGIPWSTYQRVEKGHPMSGETLAVILRWMLAE